jgi:hypothetical protein
MYLDDQVCSIEYAEKLKELGVKQESLFYYTHSDWGIMPKSSIDFKNGDPTSAFTAGELVQMSEGISGIEYSYIKKKYYTGNSLLHNVKYHKTFSDAVAYRLILAIKESFFTIERVNKNLSQDNE